MNLIADNHGRFHGVSVVVRGESTRLRFDTSFFFDEIDLVDFLRRLVSARRCCSARSRFSISTGSYFMTNLSRLFKNLARSASSGYPCSSSAHNSFHAIRFRPVLVLIHALSKLRGEQKFCVTATVSVRFNTACHQPFGACAASPALCASSKQQKPLRLGAPPAALALRLARGRMKEK